MNKEIEKRIHEFAEQMYQVGYAEGTKAHDGEKGSIYYGGYADGYQDGLIEAWRCARKIGEANQLTLERMGFEIIEEWERGIRLDWNPSFYVINRYSASDAIDKVNAYETARCCRTCKWDWHNKANFNKDEKLAHCQGCHSTSGYEAEVLNQMKAEDK